MSGLVIPCTRADVEHAGAVTVALREEEPPLGLDEHEQICPACRLAQNAGGFSWGVCRDCIAAALA